MMRVASMKPEKALPKRSAQHRAPVSRRFRCVALILVNTLNAPPREADQRPAVGLLLGLGLCSKRKTDSSTRVCNIHHREHSGQ